MGRPRWQPDQNVCDRPETRGPVQSTAGQHSDLAGLDARGRPIAIVFDFVKPLLA
jgi:hypothetical protein